MKNWMSEGNNLVDGIAKPTTSISQAQKIASHVLLSENTVAKMKLLDCS